MHRVDEEVFRSEILAQYRPAVMRGLVRQETGDAPAVESSRRASPAHALLHSLLSMPHLPAEQRRAWGRIFAYYLFDLRQDPAGHIPQERRGVLGRSSEEQAEEIRRMIGLQ